MANLANPGTAVYICRDSFHLLFVSNDVMINTLEPAKFSTQGDRERPRGEEPSCECEASTGVVWLCCTGERISGRRLL